MHKRPPRTISTTAAIAAAGLLLSGCRSLDSGPVDKLHPDLASSVPDSWSAEHDTVPPGSTTGWLDDLSDRRLRDLVSRAVGKNYSLAASASRVRQAQASATIAGADRLPQLSLDLRSSRSQSIRTTSVPVGDTTPGALVDSRRTVRSTRFNQFGSNLNLSWELDLWGRLANQKKSALASLDAASADYQATRLSLAANTVKAALDLIEAEQQAALARRTKNSLRTNLEILDRQLELGNVTANTALEISLSRADVARADSNIATNERGADAARRRLQTLLGDYPDGSLESLENFPTLKRRIPAGLPSTLLLRRPDLIAAERRVDAALQDLAASRKALLPSIRLTGSTGRSSTDEFADLLNPDNLVWSIAGSLTQTVFQGGRLAAGVSLSKARLNELANTYSETALQAFNEVETTLAAERYFATQQAALQEAETESSRAEDLALSQFDKGLVEIITVLESQRRAFDARSSLLSTKNARLQNRIDLYLALGGDFDHQPE